jgi:hypothetical protein
VEQAAARLAVVGGGEVEAAATATATTTRRKIPLAMIEDDPDLQPRAKIDRATVDRYAELLRDGIVLPPVVLVFDGEKFWLADGFHRTYAHEDAGLKDIEAIVQAGDKTDAVRISLRANAEHGRPRTETDLKRAYQKAVQFGLVEPHDWKGVKELIACSQERAYTFTSAAREELERKRRRQMFDLPKQGLSYEFLIIPPRNSRHPPSLPPSPTPPMIPTSSTSRTRSRSPRLIRPMRRFLSLKLHRLPIPTLSRFRPASWTRSRRRRWTT